MPPPNKKQLERAKLRPELHSSLAGLRPRAIAEDRNVCSLQARLEQIAGSDVDGTCAESFLRSWLLSRQEAPSVMELSHPVL